MTDITAFNAAWLKAWSDKDVPGLLKFYAADCVYKDAQTAKGLSGHAELGPYLTGLFAATPPMTYVPDEVWPIPGGFCGRWYCDLGANGKLRGFDLVLLRGAEIALNEVYVHQLP
jgi:SnoaL-like domain